DPALGDDISVTAQDAPATASDAGAALPGVTAGIARSPRIATVQPSAFPWPALWIALALIAAGGGIAAVTRLRRTERQPRRLSEAERREFVSRFQALLERGEGNVADRP